MATLSTRCTVLGVLFAVMALVVLGLEQELYQIFGMTRATFDKGQLKKAYRRLAKKYHPDKNPDNPKAVQELIRITEAYETLEDDNKRKIYDAYGKEGLKSGAHGAGDFHHEDIFRQFFGANFDFGSFGHGGHQHQHRVIKTPDTKVELAVALADAYRGVTLTVNLNKQKKCGKCKGVGADRPEDVVTCSECHGHGVKVFTQQIGMGFYQKVQMECKRCSGQGRVFKTVCSKCKGRKVVREDEQLQIKIDAGCPTGHVIKVQGGSDEAPGVEAGDLYIVVRTEEHPVFKRDGAQLYTELVIGLRDALLGFNKTIKHMDGRLVQVKRDAVTQPNQVLSIPDEGMPEHGDTPAGNLHVHVRVLLPEKLTGPQKELFERGDFWAAGKDEL